MRHLLILSVALALIGPSVVFGADEEKKEATAACCTVKDGKVVCTNGETCTKDCDKCPDKDTCDKACGETIVTVNGVKVTEGEIAKALDKRLSGQAMQMQGQEIPDSYKQQMRQRILDMKVDQILMDQEISKRNLKITDEQIMDEIKGLAVQQGQTMEDVEKEIAAYGMTMDDLKEQIAFRVKIKTLMKAEMKDAAEVAQEDVEKFYNENPQYFEHPEQIKASHILCGKRGITEEEYPAELEKIKEVQAKLKKGEKFEDLAKEYSTCPSAANGGDLGFFGKGQMDPAFETAAFETKVGDTTDIVKTSFGYHLIMVTDKQEAGKTPLPEVQDKIKDHLASQKEQQFWTGFDAKMKENAKIEYSKDELARQEALKAAQEAQRQMMMQQMQQRQQVAPAPKPEEK